MTKEELERFVKREMSVAQIARHYGCSTSTIYRRFAQWGLRRSPLIPKEELRKLIEEDDLSADQCADYYGCSLSTIHRTMKKHGLKIKPLNYYRDKEICELYELGVKQSDIARKFNIARQQVFAVIKKNR